eukprot:jgi/Mesvir1/29083/Mv18389-RA.1
MSCHYMLPTRNTRNKGTVDQKPTVTVTSLLDHRAPEPTYPTPPRSDQYSDVSRAQRTRPSTAPALRPSPRTELLTERLASSADVQLPRQRSPARFAGRQLDVAEPVDSPRIRIVPTQEPKPWQVPRGFNNRMLTRDQEEEYYKRYFNISKLLSPRRPSSSRPAGTRATSPPVGRPAVDAGASGGRHLSSSAREASTEGVIEAVRDSELDGYLRTALSCVQRLYNTKFLLKGMTPSSQPSPAWTSGSEPSQSPTVSWPCSVPPSDAHRSAPPSGASTLADPLDPFDGPDELHARDLLSSIQDVLGADGASLFDTIILEGKKAQAEEEAGAGEEDERGLFPSRSRGGREASGVPGDSRKDGNGNFMATGQGARGQRGQRAASAGSVRSQGTVNNNSNHTGDYNSGRSGAGLGGHANNQLGGGANTGGYSDRHQPSYSDHRYTLGGTGGISPMDGLLLRRFEAAYGRQQRRLRVAESVVRKLYERLRAAQAANTELKGQLVDAMSAGRVRLEASGGVKAADGVTAALLDGSVTGYGGGTPSRDAVAGDSSPSQNPLLVGTAAITVAAAQPSISRSGSGAGVASATMGGSSAPSPSPTQSLPTSAPSAATGMNFPGASSALTGPPGACVASDSSSSSSPRHVGSCLPRLADASPPRPAEVTQLAMEVGHRVAGYLRERDRAIGHVADVLSLARRHLATPGALSGAQTPAKGLCPQVAAIQIAGQMEARAVAGLTGAARELGELASMVGYRRDVLREGNGVGESRAEGGEAARGEGGSTGGGMAMDGEGGSPRGRGGKGSGNRVAFRLDPDVASKGRQGVHDAATSGDGRKDTSSRDPPSNSGGGHKENTGWVAQRLGPVFSRLPLAEQQELQLVLDELSHRFRLQRRAATCVVDERDAARAELARAREELAEARDAFGWHMRVLGSAWPAVSLGLDAMLAENAQGASGVVDGRCRRFGAACRL